MQTKNIGLKNVSERWFTEEEYDIFSDLFDTELSRIGLNPFSAKRYIDIVKEILQGETIISIGHFDVDGKIEFRKFKRFSKTILRALYFEGKIQFTLEVI